MGVFWAGDRQHLPVFKDTGHAPEPDWLAAQLAEAEDPTPIIVTTAQEQDVPLCAATLETFIGILGAEAANLALKVLATGGLYLGGGIPPRILSGLGVGPLYAGVHQ